MFAGEQNVTKTEKVKEQQEMEKWLSTNWEGLER